MAGGIPKGRADTAGSGAARSGPANADQRQYERKQGWSGRSWRKWRYAGTMSGNYL